MSRFDELKAKIEKHPAVQEAAPRQHAVLATARMIYNWRRAAGLSQLELAKAIGEKKESISRIERGTSEDGPELSTLSAIAEACGHRLVIGGKPVSEQVAKDEREVVGAWTVVEEITTCF